MIKQISLAVLCMSAMALSHNALSQDVRSSDAQPEKLVEQKVGDWISVGVSPKQNSLLNQVFQCRFFTAVPRLETPHGESMMFGEFLFYESAEGIQLVEQPHTTQPLPQLAGCLRADLYVKDKRDAELVLDAIQVLYPEESSFSEPVRLVEKTAQGWHLINGSFFEKRAGYVIQLDETGRITSLERSLEL